MIDHTLDHVVINVGRELDVAAAEFERMGFEVSPRGHHSIGTANHVVVFESTYLELIGLPPGFSGTAPTPLVEPPCGLKALALKAGAVAPLQQALERRGFSTLEILGLNRPVPVHQGSALAKFRVLQLQRQPVLPLAFFWCEHGTPELIWQKSSSGHRNGVREIVAIEVPVADPEKSGVTCAGLLGRKALNKASVELGRSVLRFLDGSAEQPQGRNGGPSAVLSLGVESMDAFVASLRKRGISCVEDTSGRVTVAAPVLGGLILRFEPLPGDGE